MFSSRFMPCADCGESVDRTAFETHRCDPERVLDHRIAELRDEIDAFEPRLHRYLGSPRGRFESWMAARDIRRRAA